jgi:hypothetical protein
VAEVVRPKPGLAFSIPIDSVLLVGLVTHDLPKIGSLVWIAAPTFDAQPTSEQVEQITAWRWPVLVPLAAAIRRRIASPIGTVPLPPALEPFPTMRSGNKKAGWTAFTEVGGVRHRLGSTNDPSLPIYKVVNDTRLKEMVVSGWRPEDEW